MNILGVRVDEETEESAIAKMRYFLSNQSSQKFTIFTPNPEMIVDAQKNVYFKNVLNQGSLNLCDGRGVELVGQGRLVRLPGVDFMVSICAEAEKFNWSIYLLGTRSADVLQQARDFLKIMYPKLNVVGLNTGLAINMNSETEKLQLVEEENRRVVEAINRAKPHVLFVAFGHGKQEKWIAENLSNLEVKVCMGVGGSLDFLSGRAKRAPRLLRKFGLEWLWRLLAEPSRIGRIYKATFQFLYYYVKSKYQKTPR